MPSAASSLPAGPRAQPIHFHPRVPPLRYGIRAIAGPFNRARWRGLGLTQLLFLSLCWLQWDGRPLVGFDFALQQVHLFGALFGPQDLLLLTLLLIAGALALFIASAVGGRVFCGFACPQTVYTALFLWLEQRVLGTPGQRQRRQAQGSALGRGAHRLLVWALWAAASLVLGWTLAAYFSSGPDLWRRTWQGQVGGGEWALLLGYAAFTFAQAGLLREKVCQHMCPYARFQGVMGTPHTQSVVYDAARGEPRRGSPVAAPAAQAGGACVDCHLCVEVCPAGIDIRQGLQYECIGCGLCIDACDHVMRKARQPTGLIRFAAQNGAGWRTTLRQPRVRAYFALLALALLAVAATVAVRVPLQVEVVRDRGVLARPLGNGGVENVYRVHIQNYDTVAHTYDIAVAGAAPGLERVALSPASAAPVHIAAGGERTLAVAVVRPFDATAAAAVGRGDGGRVLPLTFHVQARSDAAQARSRASSFLLPR